MAPPVQMTDMFDSALLGILQHVGNIQDFLQIYFGFLYRKTDFYRLLSGPEERMGFPPGVAEKMVYKTYKLFEKMAEEERERRVTEILRRDEEARVPPVALEEEVIAGPPTEGRSQEEEEEKKKKEEEENPGPEASAPDASSEKISTSSSAAASSSSSSSSCASSSSSSSCASSSQPSSRDPPGPGRAAERSRDFQADPDSYNGAVRDNYSWSQDYTDVEVRVFVPKTVLKGRQVRVVLQPSSLAVCVVEGQTETRLLQGDFTHRINTETSLWSLEPGRCVVLSLSKTSEVWWNAVLKGEEEIDVNKINRERSMASVDEEEHAVLDRLSFDYHQKLQGKPQSHEMKVHDMLRKGWDAEGSPFRGQQFDPSMFDIPPSAVQF